MLAEAALRYAGGPPRPPQLAVLGPTQTGKSTIVNLLCRGDFAGVSPLAGFTVRAHGFALGGADASSPAGTAQAYAVEQSPASPPLPDCVVWDTPDFDSLAAHEYEQSVLEIAALADVHVFVLSKEKYGDLSAWRMLELVAPLRRPLLIVLNKLSPDAADVIERSLRQRLAERAGRVPDAAIVRMSHRAAPPTAAGLSRDEEADAIRRAAADLVAKAPVATNRSADARRGAARLAAAHWREWTEPARREHETRQAWRGLVRAELDSFAAAYERDYLNHPQRYDAFRRASIELLRLLEIPRLTQFITRARAAVTWPLRQAIRAGRSLVTGGGGAAGPHDLGPEAAILRDAARTLLHGLQRDVARQRNGADATQHVWAALDRRLDEQSAALESRFDAALAAHDAQVEQQTRECAREIFEELRRQPARLAALRAARATIDAGAIALAVKSGGLAPIDALYAPATFALTSLLVEGFAGLQMKQAFAGLRARQRSLVQRELIGESFEPALYEIAENLTGPGIVAVPMTRLREAERYLAEFGGGAADA